MILLLSVFLNCSKQTQKTNLKSFSQNMRKATTHKALVGVASNIKPHKPDAKVQVLVKEENVGKGNHFKPNQKKQMHDW